MKIQGSRFQCVRCWDVVSKLFLNISRHLVFTGFVFFFLESDFTLAKFLVEIYELKLIFASQVKRHEHEMKYFSCYLSITYQFPQRIRL